jgi:hypothetical protein
MINRRDESPVDLDWSPASALRWPLESAQLISTMCVNGILSSNDRIRRK